MAITIQEAITGLQEIAAKYPDATMRGDYIDMQFSTYCGKIKVEVAVTDQFTEQARFHADAMGWQPENPCDICGRTDCEIDHVEEMNEVAG